MSFDKNETSTTADTIKIFTCIYLEMWMSHKNSVLEIMLIIVDISNTVPYMLFHMVDIQKLSCCWIENKYVCQPS